MRNPPVLSMPHIEIGIYAGKKDKEPGIVKPGKPFIYIVVPCRGWGNENQCELGTLF